MITRLHSRTLLLQETGRIIANNPKCPRFVCQEVKGTACVSQRPGFPPVSFWNKRFPGIELAIKQINRLCLVCLELKVPHAGYMYTTQYNNSVQQDYAHPLTKAPGVLTLILTQIPINRHAEARQH